MDYQETFKGYLTKLKGQKSSFQSKKITINLIEANDDKCVYAST
jgi:hypothetical protein